jgi:hypothetical protein
MEKSILLVILLECKLFQCMILLKKSSDMIVYTEVASSNIYFCIMCCSFQTLLKLHESFIYFFLLW